MTAEQRIIRRLRKAEDIAAELDKLEAEIRAIANRKNGKATPSAQDKRRAEHRASTGDLRAFVGERCGGKSEISGTELGLSWEMHHVENGGHRRSRQRPGNVLAATWDEHRAAHRGDLDVLRKIAAAPTLDAEARREAQHRVDKLLESRGTAVRLAVRSDKP